VLAGENTKERVKLMKDVTKNTPLHRAILVAHAERRESKKRVKTEQKVKQETFKDKKTTMQPLETWFPRRKK
jgi:hypothetical protein